MNQDKIIELAANLYILCDLSKDQADKVLRRHINHPGDYMGTGYDFLDAFNRIWQDWEETVDEETYRAVYLAIRDYYINKEK